MAKPNVPAQRVRELLDYDKDTGIFTRRVKVCGRALAGDIAGTKVPDGYIDIGVDGVKYRAHRLAWVHVTGEWPKCQIDHIDGCRDNNAFANLRDVTQSVNQQNRKSCKSGNSSGFLGVSKDGSKWASRIRSNGVMHNLGAFETPELAHAVYVEAKRRLHPGNTI